MSLERADNLHEIAMAHCILMISLHLVSR